MWGWMAAAVVAAAAGMTGYRLRTVRRALVAERAARCVEGAAAARELAAVEADIAAFAEQMRAELAGWVARERVLAEASVVVDGAWARHQQEQGQDGSAEWMEGGSDA